MAKNSLASFQRHHAQHRSLEGQTHDIVPAVLAPVLEEFFKG